MSTPRIPITRKLIASWCDERTLRLAEAIVEAGRVGKLDLTEFPTLKAPVREALHHRHVKLIINRINPTFARSECACAACQRNGICEHGVALALEYNRLQNDPERLRLRAEEERHARRIAEGQDFIPTDPSGRPATINLHYELEGGTLRVSFDVPDEGIISPDEINEPLALNDHDLNLLEVLEDICEGKLQNAFTPSPDDWVNILQLADASNFISLTLADEPLEQQLATALSPDAQTLTVSLKNPTDDAQHYYVSGRIGYAISECYEVHRLSAILPAPLRALYDGPVTLPRSALYSFYRNEYPLLQKAGFKPTFDAIRPDAFEERAVTPQIVLSLKGSQASVAVKLYADYPDAPRLVAFGDGDYASPSPEDPFLIRVRNKPFERDAIRQLVPYGVTGLPGDALEPVIGVRNVLNLLGKGIPAFHRLGWRVELEGPIEAIAQTAKSVIPIVKVQTHPDGSFEVQQSFEADGRHLSPAAVQTAIQKGDGYLIEEGETFLLDSQAVEQMRDIFRDCPSQAGRAPGSFRIPRRYAPYVQASLAELEGFDVEAPPDWMARASAQKGSDQLQPVALGDLEGTLRPYQKLGVYWMRFLEQGGFGGLLADEMGLGKTLQTLTWLSLPRVDEASRGQPAMVICPTSLVENWAREAQKFVPHLRTLVISGAGRERAFEQIPQSDLVITSYALLRRDIERYQSYNFSAAVLDEAQHIKNRSTQNALATKQIRAHAKLVLSGTPVENSVADLWSIMDFLMPGYLGDYESFRLRYELPIAEGNSTQEAATANAEASRAQLRLRRKLAPFLLRRLKSDVAKDLPKKIRRVSWCRLSPDQERVYNDLLAKSRTQIGGLVKQKGFQASRMEIFAILLKLRQVCCHLALLKERPVRSGEAPSAKLEHLLEQLEEARQNGSRVLIFSQFTSMLQILQEELSARGIRTCYLDGATKDRLGVCTRFNQDRTIDAFLISLKAGGTGLNLTGADVVIHYDPWWNPAAEEQATDRAHRIGQTRTVYAIKLITQGTIEEKVLNLQQRKQQVIDATIGSPDSAATENLSWDDIRSLIDL